MLKKMASKKKKAKNKKKAQRKAEASESLSIKILSQRHTSYAHGFKRRVNLFFIGSYIIGFVFAFEGFVLWEDNVLMVPMIASFWAFPIAILYSIFDNTILFLVLYNFMDNRGIGLSSETIFIAATLIITYFQLRYLFIS